MGRVKGAKIIAIKREFGRTGPPLGDQSGFLQDPMVPAVENAQRKAVLLSPSSDCGFRLQYALQPPFAPEALVIIGCKRRSSALAETTFVFQNVDDN